VRAALLAAALSLVLPPPAAAQGTQPLHKTDLIRVLTGGALSKAEVADLVRRNCLSFTPTLRDRQDLVALGADSGIMRNVDACATARVAVPPPPRRQPPTRRPADIRATPRPTPTPTPPPRPTVAQPASQPAASPPPTRVVEPVPTRPPAPAPARTGFVSGLGQRGVVGQRAALPVDLEVRDSTGTPLSGVPVTLTVSNGRLVSESGAGSRTDSIGRVRVAVVLGERAGVTVITAAIGKIVRQAMLYPAPGPPARLVAIYKGETVDRELVVDPDVASLLHVSVQDAYGNVLAGAGIVAAVADGGVLKVMRVTPDSLGALVQLKPGRAGGGTTGLVLQAGAVRLDLRVSVGARSR
jgi:hypothetical protein